MRNNNVRSGWCGSAIARVLISAFVAAWSISVSCHAGGISHGAMAPGREWSRLWGSVAYDTAGSLCMGANGEVYIVGSLIVEDDGAGSGAGRDICLSRFNDTGQCLSTRLIDLGGGMEYGEGVAVGQSGVVHLAGWSDSGFGSKVWVGCFDDMGCSRWQRMWGDEGRSYCGGVAVDRASNTYVAGYTQGSSFADLDLCLIKLGPDGSKCWSQVWGSAFEDRAAGVAVDSLGNAYVVGLTYGSFDRQTNSGSLCLGVERHETSDLCLSKFSPEGKRVWSRIWGTRVNDVVGGIAISVSGDVHVSGSPGDSDGQGYTTEAFGLWIFDGCGTMLRDVVWGGTSRGWCNSGGVAVDREGAVYVAGNTANGFDGQSSSAEGDVFLTKFDADCRRLWTRIWGSEAADRPHGVAVDKALNVYVLGETSGALDGQTNSGLADLFLSKWSQSACGNQQRDAAQVPVFRALGHTAAGVPCEHLLTASVAELNAILASPLWQYEGVAWYAHTNAMQGTTPLYRLVNISTMSHLYTVDWEEYVRLDNTGDWLGEWITYYVYPVDSVCELMPVHRFWNALTGTYFFTADETEAHVLYSRPECGYAYEGVAFYVFPVIRTVIK